MLELITKKVSWVKIAGKNGSSMVETRGSGLLTELEIGKCMRIYGDSGVRTSTIIGINISDNNTLVVSTLNSTYLVKKIEEQK